MPTTLTKNCDKYFAESSSHVDAPIADDRGACRTLTYLLNKALVLHNSGGEKKFKCLHYKEKLSK